MSNKREKAAQKRAHKAAGKAINAAMIGCGRALCKSAASKPPVDFQQWGTTKTRARLKLAEITLRRSSNITIKAADLQAMHARLIGVSALSVDDCAAILTGDTK